MDITLKKFLNKTDLFKMHNNKLFCNQVMAYKPSKDI